MEEESATVLMPTDIKKFMEFAGQKIFFSPEEVTDMKRFGPVGIKVIAFKSLEHLKEKHHIRAAQFLYPNEGDVRGSTKLFIALLTKCLEKKVMAVCQYIPRENISPKFVALVPQAEVFKLFLFILSSILWTVLWKFFLVRDMCSEFCQFLSLSISN